MQSRKPLLALALILGLVAGTASPASAAERGASHTLTAAEVFPEQAQTIRDLGKKMHRARWLIREAVRTKNTVQVMDAGAWYEALRAERRRRLDMLHAMGTTRLTLHGAAQWSVRRDQLAAFLREHATYRGRSVHISLREGQLHASFHAPVRKSVAA